MVLDWMRKIHQMEYAHRYESLYWVKIEKWVGIFAFALSTFIAFSFRFPKVDTEFYNKLPFFLHQDFFVAFTSTAVAILTGLQTFLKPGEKSGLHKNTANEYESLRHKIELVLTMNESDEDFKEKITTIKKEWENLDAINVSNKNFSKGKNRVNSFKKYPKELGFLEDIQ